MVVVKKNTFLGQTLIELLLVMGLAGIILPALIIGIVASREGKVQQEQKTIAVNLLQQAEEAIRNAREKGWNGFAIDGTYHPEVNLDFSWDLAPNAASDSSGFTTTIEMSSVYRDNNGAIASSGGILDPSTKQLQTTISWIQPFPNSITSVKYFARYDNLTWIQTAQADFNAGITTNTSVTNTSGGEVILGAGGGGGDWCQPSKSITELDLPKSGVANAISAIEGQVFAGTGDNSSGVSFANVPLTLVDPPTASVAATFDGYKTNAVFGEPNYAYLGTDTNSKEFVIMSLTQYSDSPTNSKYLGVGSINLPGAQNGVGIYVLSNKAYVLGSGGKLYIYDITNRAKDYGDADILNTTGNANTSGFTLSGTGKKIIVSLDSSSGKTYAYIVTSSTSNQLQILDVSNPATVLDSNASSIRSQLTLGSSQAGVDLFVNSSGTRVYIATSYSAGKRNLFIVNTTTKNSLQEVIPTGSGYNTAEMNPKGLTVVTGNRVIIVGTGGSQQYQVIKIANETDPTSCAGLSYATGVNGVASVLQSNGYAYSYIITGDANAELKIILGGAGGQYSSAGTFESSILDAGYKTAFNRFSATFNQPSQTTIGFQVAAANPADGNCTTASYTYIGPNLTSLTTDLFSGNSEIPLLSSGLYQNPGRCFRYKVYFTSSDPAQTPELEDFTVNYSP